MQCRTIDTIELKPRIECNAIRRLSGVDGGGGLTTADATLESVEGPLFATGDGDLAAGTYSYTFETAPTTGMVTLAHRCTID